MEQHILVPNKIFFKIMSTAFLQVGNDLVDHMFFTPRSRIL